MGPKLVNRIRVAPVIGSIMIIRQCFLCKELHRSSKTHAAWGENVGFGGRELAVMCLWPILRSARSLICEMMIIILCRVIVKAK